MNARRPGNEKALMFVSPTASAVGVKGSGGARRTLEWFRVSAGTAVAVGEVDHAVTMLAVPFMVQPLS